MECVESNTYSSKVVSTTSLKMTYGLPVVVLGLSGLLKVVTGTLPYHPMLNNWSIGQRTVPLWSTTAVIMRNSTR